MPSFRLRKASHSSSRLVSLISFPIIFFCATSFVILERGRLGELHSPWLHRRLFAPLYRVHSLVTDLKFRFRGARAPKNKIVVLELDSGSIEAIGRWPWHRDYVAYMIQRVLELGAVGVGLDILLSEPDPPLREEIAIYLKKKGIDKELRQFETDPLLEALILQNRAKVSLAWATEAICQPLYALKGTCPVEEDRFIASLPEDLRKFTLKTEIAANSVRPRFSPVPSVPTSVIRNLRSFDQAANFQGFVNGFRDPDGVIRRSPTVVLMKGEPYPSLSLSMFQLVRSPMRVHLDSTLRVSRLEPEKGGAFPAANRIGLMELNYRGKGRTFPYIPAIQIFKDPSDKANEASLRKLLDGAAVLVGASALGLADIAATPFDAHTPGVEIHATALDNLLSADALHTPNSSFWIVLAMMLLGIPLILWMRTRLESKGVFLLFGISIALVFLLDFKVLFPMDQNWNTGFLYVEFGALLITTIAVDYFNEEKSRKFLRSALSKYVSPTVVENIVKDPSQLSLGGKKENLTVLFSDIRSFSHFAERCDAKKIAEFLNTYFGIMTEIVFKHGGTLDKYIGDALMAFWGAPVPTQTHSLNAAQAAIEMARAVEANRTRFKELFDIDLQIGVGINTGIVSVGNMGSNQAFGYTVIGNEVNVASRIEGLTKVYGAQILTTHATLEAFPEESALPCRLLDRVRVVGVETPVDLYEVLTRTWTPEGTTEFQQGREIYAKGDWKTAIAHFENVMRLEGTVDRASLLFIERCKLMMASPPARWDGVWTFEHK